MYIRFPRRSLFYDPLRQGIKAGRARLEAGKPIEIRLRPGGYQGKRTVVIRDDDSDGFEAEGSMKDPTRFPQRIRATAWALHDEVGAGRFVVQHDRESGVVTIERAG